MEAFGLLNFLKNVLLSTAPAPLQTEEDRSATPPPTPAATNTETSPRIESQKETAPAQTDKENVFLQFMAAHDERAKRTRKP